jgi:hypothetical protein
MSKRASSCRISIQSFSFSDPCHPRSSAANLEI